MKKSDYPHIDNFALWESIVKNKHAPSKQNLLQIKDKIHDRYTFYEQHYNSLDEITPLPKPEWASTKADLISCYGNNVNFKSIKKSFRQIQANSNQTKCLYCMINRPNTLDHYFDKDTYPEFSVYVPNLLPCCSECNSLKGTSMFTLTGSRKFIHFYHDMIPPEQFLFVDFSCPDADNIPVIHVYLKFSEESSFSNIARCHFAALGLITKYQSEIREKLVTLLETLKISNQSGISEEILYSLLSTRHTALCKQYGNNYWETVMYQGLLSNRDFLHNQLSVVDI